MYALKLHHSKGLFNIYRNPSSFTFSQGLKYTKKVLVCWCAECWPRRLFKSTPVWGPEIPIYTQKKNETCVQICAFCTLLSC